MIVDIVIPARNPDAGFGERILALAHMEGTRRIGAIVIVDDGSDRPLASTLAGLPSQVPLKFVRLDGTGNRSIARNAGARAAGGSHLYFVDSDCAPSDPGVLSRLARAFDDPDVTVAGGPVRGVGTGFWHRYQERAVIARRRRGNARALTSANLLVARDAFDAVGGFDEGYTSYGFEDRDLILRLVQVGAAAFRPDAVVEHADALSMVAVSRKMFEAGRGSSERFRERHPEAYAALGYARIDASLRPWLRPLASIVAPAAIRLAPWIDRVVDRHAPFWLAGPAVKLVGALSFLYGTSTRSSSA